MSNDTRFGEITFSKTFELKDAKVFSILVDREYRYQANDNLTRHLRTIETSDLYDCRDLLMRPLIKDDSGKTLYSYTTLSDFGQTDVTVSGSSSGGSASATASTKVLTQVISFEFRFSTSGSSPTDLECQAFADTSMMTYTFKFSNGNDSYYLTPSKTSVKQGEGYCCIRITVNWTQDMGTLFDSKWSTCNCMVLAKTNSNFSYKMNEFSIRRDGGNKATDANPVETNVIID